MEEIKLTKKELQKIAEEFYKKGYKHRDDGFVMLKYDNFIEIDLNEIKEWRSK